MDDKTERRKAWIYFGILFGFKLWTALLVLVFFAWSSGNLNLLLMVHVPWILAIIVIAAIPLAYYYRLVRVRAKRAELQHKEWHTDSTPMPEKNGTFAFLRRLDRKKVGSYLVLLPGPPAAIFHFMHARYAPGFMAMVVFIAALLVFHTNILRETRQAAGESVTSDEAERRSRYD
jgi:hypothetical protein